MSVCQNNITYAMIGALAFDVRNSWRDHAYTRLLHMTELFDDMKQPLTFMRTALYLVLTKWQSRSNIDGREFLTDVNRILPCDFPVRRSVIGRRNMLLLRHKYHLQCDMSAEWQDEGCIEHAQRSSAARVTNAPGKQQKWEKKVRRRLKRLRLFPVGLIGLVARYVPLV